MESPLRARIYALELLTTQLISEFLRATPEPAKQAEWAREHLQRLAEIHPVESDSLDDEARLRVGIKEDIGRILAAALARAQTLPLRPRSWDIGPQAG
ncbi:MAG TPA: hypothetical protein VF502_17745 [Stellaceae bacterium]